MTQTVPGFPRLTIEANKLGGQPCLRGYRFGVDQVLELLGSGKTPSDIITEFPFLEPEDVNESLRYAASVVQRDFYLASA
jgi:uncharacterized protein (DUF433 family)